MRFSKVLTSGVLLGAAVIALGFSACSDDTVAPDPNLGKKAAVKLLNANPDYPLPVVFAVGTSNISGALNYGSDTTVQAQIGQTTVTVKGTGGSALQSVGLNIDSTRPSWVVYAGSGNTGEAFAVDVAKNTADIASALANGQALVRVIHASKNLSAISLHEKTPNGSTVASNVQYKSGSTFGAVDTATKTLVLTQAATTDTIAVPRLSAQFAAGKLYTIIVYGAPSAAVPAQGLMARIVSEP